MKELTIEEKAKAYDELLIKLQKAKVDNNVCDERYCCVIDDIVPEIKESKDEKIRKGLIDFVNQYGDNFYGQISKEYAIAWLEKQGGKNTAWSEEDEEIRNNCIYWLEKARKYFEKDEDLIYDKKWIVKCTDWLKNRVFPQLKQEWSEEDEKILSDIIKDLVHPWNEYIPDRIEDEIKWLKNRLKFLSPQSQNIMSEDEFAHIVGYLVQDIVANEHMPEGEKQPTRVFVEKYYNKLRPQSTWKPSDEQIEALEHFVRNITESGFASPYDSNTKLVYSLLNDLKKLKL